MTEKTPNNNHMLRHANRVGGVAAVIISILILPPARAKGCIYALGDSLTVAYVPALRASLPHVVILDGGLGGQDAIAIAARAGAIPTKIRLARSTSDTGDETRVAGVDPDLLRFSGTETSQFGRIGKTRGQLNWSKRRGYTFEPPLASPLPLADEVPFDVDRENTRKCILILWAGRNGHSDMAATLYAIRSTMTLWQASGHPAYILSVINGAGEGRGTLAYQQIAKLNAVLQMQFGKHYIDVRSWLIKYASNVLPDSLSPSSRADVEQDIVPSNVRADQIHLNAPANSLLAQLLAQQLSGRLHGDDK